MNEPTLVRVERICAQLLQAHQQVTFTAVAQLAGIARATLYRDPELRAVIDEHRTRQAEACTLSGLAHRLRTCAPHSKPSPTTSDATKNDYGDSNDEPAVRQAEKLRAIGDR